MYLLAKQVNLAAPMISDNQDPAVDGQIELLYYSQIQYIPALIERGCQLDPTRVPSSVEKMLIKGNITKVITLHKYGAITKQQLLGVVQQPGLIFRVLDHLYERIYVMCQQISSEPARLKAVCDEVIKNYLNVFKLFFKNGVGVDQMEQHETFLQRVLNTYLIDLIRLTLEYQPRCDDVELLHYSNFDLTNRQVMRNFYNDDIYLAIQALVKIGWCHRRSISKNRCSKEEWRGWLGRRGRRGSPAHLAHRRK